ncbi:MAG TPA: HD-GYP domain-containing protein, partial [Gammaproteobacteria bacterium]|nr:HD-GYP domain-containing protein [Gammaproteobacteria bacterium]
VVAVLLTATAGVLASGFDVNTMGSVAFFALLAFTAHLLEYHRPRGSTGNISFIPYMAGVAVAPSAAAALATALSVAASEILLRRAPVKAVFNVAQYTASVAVASIVYLSAGGYPLSLTTDHSIIPFAAAFFSYVVANTASVSGVIAVSERRNVRQVWRQIVGGSVLFDLFALPAVYGFAYVFAAYGAMWTLAVALPLFGIRQLYKANYQLERINEELLQLMVAAIEARDPYTSGHSQRVATYSRIVANAAGVSARHTERVYTAALLHDVGKIHEEFAPILRKPGRLSDEEFAVMKSHSAKGAALVARVSQFADIVAAIRGHHEAWNGSGYPDGLAGDKIPYWARIIAVADTIDAMTTDRPYREGLDPDTVRTELAAQIGRQFDPRITAALIDTRVWPTMMRAINSFQPDRAAARVAVGRLTPRHSAAVASQLAR